MNPKALMVVLFCVVFVVSFVIYLLMVNVIAPHIDLSSTAKGNIEVAPELDNFDVNSAKQESAIKDLQEKAMQDLGMYESDASGMMTDDYTPMEELNKDDDLASETGTLDTSPVRAPGDVAPQPVSNNEEEYSEEEPGVKVELEVPSNTELAPLNPAEGDSQASTEEPKTPSTVNRVLVGSYGDINDAKKAYDNMMDSDMDVAPIIKEVEGKYTLQVGAFSDKNKAKDLADKLKQKEYSAEVKSE